MKTEKQHFVYHSDNRFTLVGIVYNSSIQLGLAACRYGDQFSRKMGRAIAYGRAEKKPFAFISIANGQNEADLFYQYGVKAAEEKVNLINARLYFNGTHRGWYVEQLKKGDNPLIGNYHESDKFKFRELKISRDDYDFIK